MELIRFRNKIHHSVLRQLHGTNAQLTAANLMYPVFLHNDDDYDLVEEIESMPGQFRFGRDAIVKHLEPLVKKGLKSVLLFGVVKDEHKDVNASAADNGLNPVIPALEILRKKFPQLLLACDLCLCPYTIDGQCQLYDIDKTNIRLAQVAISYARAGAHVVAPSDMTDNRILAIKDEFGLKNIRDVAILSYAAKFASNFYGPFRDAAKSAPAQGDRACFQLPSNSTSLALRAVERDIAEGADMVMVKPGMPYLDIVQQVKAQHPDCPLFAYQVSGEYCMIYHAAKAGALDLNKALMESMTSFRRAGADCIITYFTPTLLDLLQTQ